MLEQRRQMNPVERRAAFSVAGIFSTRMLGLFMIFPVFALFAQQEFEGVTGTQIGIAIGIYGLTQAILQMPYGILSDRFGRKPLIILGMLVFMVGSIICALADSMEMMIVGRAIQGMGAVAAVLMATVADLVSEQFRLRAMSIVGMTIGLSFTASLVAGPVLGEFLGVRGIFWVIAGLAVLGMLLVVFAVPPISHQSFQREAEADPSQFKDVIKNPQLLRLDIGVFVLHATLTAMFIAVPFMIHDLAGLNSLSHWELYLPVMLLSFVLMVPFIIQAESKGKMKQVFVGAILTIALMQLALLYGASGFWTLFLWLLIFSPPSIYWKHPCLLWLLSYRLLIKKVLRVVSTPVASSLALPQVVLLVGGFMKCMVWKVCSCLPLQLGFYGLCLPCRWQTHYP